MQTEFINLIVSSIPRKFSHKFSMLYPSIKL